MPAATIIILSIFIIWGLLELARLYLDLFKIHRQISERLSVANIIFTLTSPLILSLILSPLLVVGKTTNVLQLAGEDGATFYKLWAIMWLPLLISNIFVINRCFKLVRIAETESPINNFKILFYRLSVSCALVALIFMFFLSPRA